MATFSTEVTIAHATFTPLDGQGRPNKDPTKKVDVDFNPASLQLQLSNTLEQKDGKTTEHVKTSSAKLTMDLVFDTSDTLHDVREKTQKMVKLLSPEGATKKPLGDVRPVLFEWGTFSFKGIIETYKETLDFFSAAGVPLRAGVSLTLSHQDLVFGDADEEREATRHQLSGALRGEADPVETTAGTDGTGATSVAQGSDVNGTGDTGRGVAADNGLESMRFPEGPVVVNPGVTLGPPVAFAAGGAGIAAGAGAGAAFGAGGAAGFGAAAGAGFGAGASAGFGAGASAGIGASTRAGFGAAAGGLTGAGAGAGAGTSAFAGSGAFAGAGASAGAFGRAGAFVGAGASAGAGAFAGAGVFAGAGAPAGAGAFGAGGTVTASGAFVGAGEAPIFGGRASAGIPASLGAFAGLRVPLPRPRPVFDASLLLPRRRTATLAADANASFDLAGRAHVSAGVALSARENGRPLAGGRVSFDQD